MPPPQEAHAPAPARMDEGAPTTDKAGAEGSQLAEAPAAARERNRGLLSNASSIPAWLLERFPLPEGTTAAHTQFKEANLPHFQGRLGPNQSFQGKHFARNVITVSSFFFFFFFFFLSSCSC